MVGSGRLAYMQDSLAAGRECAALAMVRALQRSTHRFGQGCRERIEAHTMYAINNERGG